MPPPVRPSVLIVDDERPFLEMLAEAFAGHFELVAVGSAEEAWEVMERRRFDVVVCDHLMPGEVGLAFLERSARRWPETRRILLTGFINPELFASGPDDALLSACLLKPVRPTELAKAILATLENP